MQNISFHYKTIQQYKKSLYLLIAANIVPLIGVLFLGWGILDLLLIYFFETAIIGFYNCFKILFVKLTITNEFKTIGIFISYGIKIFFIIIFTVHFGAMTILLGSMLYLILSVFTMQHYNIIPIIYNAWPAVLVLFISHGYSFYKNYIKGGEREKSSIMILMIRPYIRLMGLFLILFTGAFLAMGILLKFRDTSLLPVFFCIIFILLKLALDIAGHIAERRKFDLAEKISSRIDYFKQPGRFSFEPLVKKILDALSKRTGNNS